MSETTVTGTTSTALVGIGKEEVRSQISNGKSMEDLELQVDMRFGIIDSDDGINAYKWLRCSARFSDHSAPTLCQRLVG